MIKYVTTEEAYEIYDFDGEEGDFFVIDNIQFVIHG